MKTKSSVRFEPYNDNVLYDSLLDSNEIKYDPTDEDNFLDIFQRRYQSSKIKLDISVGIDKKFLDILNI